jgi:hypothetical protein
MSEMAAMTTTERTNANTARAVQNRPGGL